MIIVCAGAIGRFPVGRNAWVELQYLAPRVLVPILERALG